MIIIHQVKSAGSSLTAGICRDLGLSERPKDDIHPTIHSLNARGETLFRELRRLSPATSQVASFHLHPTKELLNFFQSEKIPAVITLRDPQDSYLALQRHATTENDFKRQHAAIRKSETLALAKIEEFNRNWRYLRGEKHILFVTFEDITKNYEATIKNIAQFYGLEDKLDNKEILSLPKVRYTGTGGVKKTNASKTKYKTYFFSDYSLKKNIYRKMAEAFPKAYRLKRKIKNYRREALAKAFIICRLPYKK